MSQLFYESTEVPTEDVPPDDNVTPPSGYTCEACGAELTYNGRGRKPRKCSDRNGGLASCYGTTSGTPRQRLPRSSGKNTQAALAVMEGYYDQLSQILLMVSPHAAAELESRIPSQQLRNGLVFDANPALTARVCAGGQKATMLAFIASNLALVLAVSRIAYMDVVRMRAMVGTLNNAGGSDGGLNLADLFSGFTQG
jgi:CRISPR/Cas system-associated protein Cas10 (large subunit of type III CRISPR-Cas system)